MNRADGSSLEGISIVVLLLSAIRVDRFSEGALLHFLESGAIVRWQERLKELMKSCDKVRV